MFKITCGSREALFPAAGMLRAGPSLLSSFRAVGNISLSLDSRLSFVNRPRSRSRVHKFAVCRGCVSRLSNRTGTNWQTLCGGKFKARRTKKSGLRSPGLRGQRARGNVVVESDLSGTPEYMLDRGFVQRVAFTKHEDRSASRAYRERLAITN